MFQDGSIQGYTGYLSKPYHQPFMGDTQYRGYPMRSREALVEMVDEAHRAGKQIAIHGNGDAAIDDILSAYEQAQQKTPRTDTRHRIEHCQTVREDQLDKMQTLGVTPSFFVQHTYYWGDRHEAIFLRTRAGASHQPIEIGVRSWNSLYHPQRLASNADKIALFRLVRSEPTLAQRAVHGRSTANRSETGISGNHN